MRPQDAKRKPQSTRCIERLTSHLQMHCTALHCMIASWGTAGRDTHIATIQSGRAAVQHHTRRADGGLDLAALTAVTPQEPEGGPQTTTVPLLAPRPLCSSESRPRTSNTDRAFTFATRGNAFRRLYRLLRAGPSREQPSGSTMMIKLQLSCTTVASISREFCEAVIVLN